MERALQEPGIASIAARLPQAKGRIGRLTGIATCDDANTFVTSFLPRYNERFVVAAALHGPAYRPLDAHALPEHTFCCKYGHTVAADNTVQLDEHRIQLLPGPTRRSYAKCRVDV